MKMSVENLLEPISAESPCGVDLGYDPQFLELETMLVGKEETQFAAAEEPDWNAVVSRCMELFQRSKDLRVALRLSIGLLRTEGLPGFCDGLGLMKGMIERYWEPLFPRLDPDDNNDPLERVNVLASLSTPMGTYGDPLQFIGRIRQAPLAESSQIGRISMADIERSATGAPNSAGTVITTAQVAGAFRSTPQDTFKKIYGAVVVAQGTVKEIDNLLTRAVGASNAVAFDPLEKCLKELQKAMAPYAAPGTVTLEGASEEGAASGHEIAQEGVGISGTVRTRQDVVRVLDQICEFYKKTEPASPVPLLLQRARRLVDMDFLQLLTELTPESLNQLKLIAGIREEEHAG